MSEDAGRSAPLPRVVQIGFHKCGTRSLEQLFRGAGHRVVKFKLRRPFRRSRNAALLIRENLAAGRKAFAGFEDFTFYADLIYQSDHDAFEPIRHFREIMRDYPDTILLLNVRRREDWIRSRFNHGHGEFLRRVMRQRGTDSAEEIVAAWREEWDNHLANVRAFMADRPGQLVEFDLDNDPVQVLVERLPEHRLRAEDWQDIGRTRGVRRHPLVVRLKRFWAHVRWRPSV